MARKTPPSRKKKIALPILRNPLLMRVEIPMRKKTTGQYREIVPPSLLVYTDSFADTSASLARARARRTAAKPSRRGIGSFGGRCHHDQS